MGVRVAWRKKLLLQGLKKRFSEGEGSRSSSSFEEETVIVGSREKV